MVSLNPYAENQGTVNFTPAKLGSNQYHGIPRKYDKSGDNVAFYFNENKLTTDPETGEKKPKIYFRKSTVNDNKSEIDRPVRDSDKVEYPLQWQLFVSGGEQQLGTPIEQWLEKGYLTQQIFYNLKAANFHTVEGVASANPAFLEGFGAAGRHLQKLAKEHVEAQQEQADAARMAEMEESIREKLLSELKDAGIIPAPKAKRRSKKTTQEVKEEIAAKSDEEQE